jgi:hypothetical protein
MDRAPPLMRLVARIETLSFSGALTKFLDDHVAVVVLDNMLYLRPFVPPDKREAVRGGADALVLLDAYREAAIAALIRTLADEEKPLVRFTLLGDALVHVTERGLVPCQPFVPRRHSSMLSEAMPRSPRLRLRRSTAISPR